MHLQRMQSLLLNSVVHPSTKTMFIDYLNSILSVTEPILEPAVDKLDDATRIQLR